MRNLICPVCGGSMIGDGFTTVFRCENAAEDRYAGHEPDSAAVYCAEIPVKHPFYEMDLEKAIELAWRDRDGFPLNPKKEPPPSNIDALAILERSTLNCGFNWITGRAALDLLRHVVKGTDYHCPV